MIRSLIASVRRIARRSVGQRVLAWMVLAWIVLGGLGLTLFATGAAEAQTGLPPAFAERLVQTARSSPGHMDSAVVGLIAERADLRDAVIAEAKRLVPDQAAAIDAAVARAFPGFAGGPVSPPTNLAGRPYRPTPGRAPPGRRTPRPPAAHDWSAEVELGGNRTTGNTETESVRFAGAVDHRYGDWHHHYEATFDLARDDGKTNAQRLTTAIDTRFSISDRFWAFGHADYEDDRFGSFDYRFTEAVGLGYRLIDTESFSLSVEAGPGARQTKLIDSDDIENELIGRAKIATAWAISETAELTNDTSVVVGRERTTTKSITALTVKIIDTLSARLAFEVRNDSEVEPGREKTDTLTTATLVYGF